MSERMPEEEWETSFSPELEAQIDAALESARTSPPPVVATSARFDKLNQVLIIVLGNGRRLTFAQEDVQGLADLEASDVTEVEIVALGTALRWEKYDVDFSIEGLIEGRTGNEKWMGRLNEARRNSAADALSRTA